ncbi:MAG: [FeFe] hydrogenase H-cluster maturation GTPase HydF [Candidatus Egerieousia sp.]
MKIRNIGIYGRRNVGKSSLINMIAGQQVAIVDSLAGTTTDPVRKRMEIYGVGPCNLIDTAGVDDYGTLGEKRVGKSLASADEVDLALIVFKWNCFGEEEEKIASLVETKGVPFILIHNFADYENIESALAEKLKNRYKTDVIDFSCKPSAILPAGSNVSDIIDAIVRKFSKETDRFGNRTILQGIVNQGDKIVFVCPVDSEAPSGRLILPQVMAIRDVLDNHGTAITVQPQELAHTLESVDNIKMVITDSQVFGYVAKVVPENIPLGSFSILLARSKGPFEAYMNGLRQIDNLREGDNVLVLESCTHIATCEDIGRVKIPKMLQKYCGCSLNFTFVGGADPVPAGNFSLVVQCGGCMASSRALYNRVGALLDRGFAVTNYGMTIAYVSGLFKKPSFYRFMQLIGLR